MGIDEVMKGDGKWKGFGQNFYGHQKGEEMERLKVGCRAHGWVG